MAFKFPLVISRKRIKNWESTQKEWTGEEIKGKQKLSPKGEGKGAKEETQGRQAGPRSGAQGPAA